MPRLALAATFFVALCTHGTWAAAQNLYQCGAIYSSEPCPGGTLVKPGDARKPEERTFAKDKLHKPEVFTAVVPRKPGDPPPKKKKKAKKKEKKAA
jgi:hypothetical protein